MRVFDDPARQSAIAQYTATYSHFADTAQLYVGTSLAGPVAATAMLFLVAADAEETDPPPSVVRDCICVECRLYRLIGPKDVPEMECIA